MTDTNTQTKPDTIIETKNLSKDYAGQTVLRNINLQVVHGERLFLIGPNGSGKTTLAEIIAGLNKPSSGKVTIFPHIKIKNSDTIRKHLIYLSFETFFYPSLTVEENLLFYLSLLKLYDIDLTQSDSELVDYALSEVKLTNAKRKMISELSLGMQHRLSVCRLLFWQPKLIILDEPYTGLDHKGEELLDQIIEQKWRQGSTIIEASHRLNFIQTYFQQRSSQRISNQVRVVILNNHGIGFDSKHSPGESLPLNQYL